MLTLYGDVDSGNVYKVRLLLAQLGIAYRRVDTTQKSRRARDRRCHAIAPETAMGVPSARSEYELSTAVARDHF